MFIFTFAGLLLGPVMGFLGDRVISIRRMVIAGLIILAGALFLFSMTLHLLVYYAALLLVAVGSTMTGWIMLMTVISRWFVRRRAVAIGLAYTVSGLGALFLVPFLVYFYDATSNLGWGGWRLAAILLGGIVLVVAAIAFAWLRNCPEDMGLLPSGATAALRQTSFSAFQALGTRAFWFIALGDGLAASGILNIPDAANSSRDAFAFAIVASTLTALVFYPVGGLLGDRYSKSSSLACFTALQVVAWAALMFAGSLVAFYLAAVALGLSLGGRTPLRVAILADYFGTSSLATILGLFGLFSGVIAFIAAPLAEFFYDSQQDPTARLIAVAVTILAAFLFWKARPPQLPQAAGAQAEPG